MTHSKRVAAIADWYTMDRGQPHLIGSRCASCRTCFFPRVGNFCRNPSCESTQFEEVKLSRTGRIWSYTNACYQPPEPYVSSDPFEPFAIAAVELEEERMIVLGQVVKGVGVEGLKIGLPMELVLETLYTDGDQDKVVWKWKPLPESSRGPSAVGSRR